MENNEAGFWDAQDHHVGQGIWGWGRAKSSEMFCLVPSKSANILGEIEKDRLTDRHIVEKEDKVKLKQKYFHLFYIHTSKIYKSD